MALAFDTTSGQTEQLPGFVDAGLTVETATVMTAVAVHEPARPQRGRGVSRSRRERGLGTVGRPPCRLSRRAAVGCRDPRVQRPAEPRISPARVGRPRAVVRCVRGRPPPVEHGALSRERRPRTVPVGRDPSGRPPARSRRDARPPRERLRAQRRSARTRSSWSPTRRTRQSGPIARSDSRTASRSSRPSGRPLDSRGAATRP